MSNPSAKAKVCLSIFLTICLCIMTPVPSIAQDVSGGFEAALVADSSMSNDITVVKSGNSIVMKSRFSPSQLVNISCNLASSVNGSFNWINTAIVTGGSTNTIVNNGDDITPIKISGQYVGGNHGYLAKWTVPANGHNKTTADLGSVWNSSGKNFTLIGVGTTNLTFAAPFTENDGIISVDETYPRDPVVYVRGGSVGNQTDNIDITGICTNNQLTPSLNNISVKCYADDIEITSNGTYYCEKLEIRERYDIMSYEEMLEYAEYHEGVLNDNSIAGVVRLENTYTYTLGLDCLVQSKVTALKKFNCTLFGALQGMPIGGASYVKRYMPNIKPKTAVHPNTGAMQSFDFAAGVNLTDFRAFYPSESYGIYYNVADFNNSAIPPSHTVDWACDSSDVRKYGFVLGYIVDDSSTCNADRIASCENYWRMWATKKSYPHAIENTIFNEGESRSFTGFRNYLCAEKMPDATMITSVKTDNAYYLYIDYNSPISNKSVSLDDYLGKTVTVLQSENFELHNSVVDSNGVTFDITDTIGNAVLKIDLKESVITAVEGSGCVVDSNSKLIYGLQSGITSLDGYISVPEGYVITSVPTLNGFGTGTLVNAVLNGEVVESYKIVIFGDVNGDGNIDSADAGVIVDVENFFVEWDSVEDAVYIKASNLNDDNNIDTTDASIVIDSENFVLHIDQTTGWAITR